MQAPAYELGVVVQDEQSELTASEAEQIVQEWRALSIALSTARDSLYERGDAQGLWDLNNVLALYMDRPEEPLGGFFVFWLADNLSILGEYAPAVATYEWVVLHHQETVFSGITLAEHATESLMWLHAENEDFEAAERVAAERCEHCSETLSEARLQSDLASVLAKASKSQEALAAYEHVAALEPEGPDDLRLVQFATVRADELRNPDRARGSFEELASEVLGFLKAADLPAFEGLLNTRLVNYANHSGCTTYQEPSILMGDLAARLGGHEVVLDRLVHMAGSRKGYMVLTLANDSILAQYGLDESELGELERDVAKKFLNTISLQLVQREEGWVLGGGQMFPSLDALTARMQDRPEEEQGDEAHGDEATDLEETSDADEELGTHRAYQVVNSARDLRLFAPWQPNVFMRSGDLAGSIVHSALVGPLAIITHLSSRCGFGIGGLHYGQAGHSGRDHFAIDFQRFSFLWVPDSTPYTIIATHDGLIEEATGGIATGDASRANSVVQRLVPDMSETDFAAAILLALITTLLGDDSVRQTLQQKIRFGAIYMHMAGPRSSAGGLRVSVGQYVRRGTVLGTIDDTGLSQWNHLHFSVHDRLDGTGATYRGITVGNSVEYGELSSQSVADGACVFSVFVPA